MVGPKHSPTQFGIYHRLQSCAEPGQKSSLHVEIFLNNVAPFMVVEASSKVPPIAVFIADFSLHKCLTFCVERNPCKGVICGCMLIKPFFPNFPVRESAIFQRRKRSELTTVLLQECATNRQNDSNLSCDFFRLFFPILVQTVFHFMVFS